MNRDCTICGRDLSPVPLGEGAEGLVDGFEAVAAEVDRALPGINNAISQRLAKQVVALKDFFAQSPLGGGGDE